MSEEQVFVTVINASREAVWKALTTDTFTEQYWHGTRARSSWQPGSRVDFLVDGDEIGCTGEVLEMRLRTHHGAAPSQAVVHVLHEGRADAASAQVTAHHDAADDHRRALDLEAGRGDELAGGVATQHVRSVRIAAVELVLRTDGLLDDEDFAAKAQHVVEFLRGQLNERAAAEVDRRRPPGCIATGAAGRTPR